MIPRQSTEMFIHMKDVPQWDHTKNYFDQKRVVLQFYEEEFRKISQGVNIGGFFVHPWLYFDLNHFITPIPTKDKKDKMMQPPLDDNALYIAESLMDAEKLNKVLFLFGCRGFRKSTFIASITQQTILTRPDGNFSIIGGKEEDLNAISSLMNKSFNGIHPAFFIPTLTKDWNSLIKFGFKDKNISGKEYVHSEIMITNADNGTDKKSEKGAGLSPIGYIMDEALHEDCLIYLEDTEKRIKDVEIGDKIYGQDGKLTSVVDKINPGIVDMYEIVFSDGRSIHTSGNHLWTVYNTNLKRWEYKTTEDILGKYYRNKFDKRYNKTTKSLIYSIPNNQPIQYPEKEFTIDPYWLGLWLGDGQKNNTAVFSIDNEIISYCEEYAAESGLTCTVRTVESHSQNGHNFRIATIINSKGQKNPLREKLRDLGVFNNKHIPNEYLRGSVKQRLELLRGLMDSDGYARSTGHAEFTSSITELAESFESLSRSLGISLKNTHRKPQFRSKGVKVFGKLSHRFRLQTRLPIFKLHRKSSIFNKNIEELFNQKQKSMIDRITIQNIIKTGEKSQAYCIKVDNDNRLFITGDYISTHNCGKYEFKKIFESAIPSFKTEYGFRLTPILSGTSGNVELSKDAREVLENPDAYDILPMNFERLNRFVPPEYITWGDDYKKKFGTFVPGQMSYRLLTATRIEKPLSEFLGINHKDLQKLKIRTTNWKVAEEEIERMRAAGIKDAKAKRDRMYYPKTIDDCFLTTTPNPFPVEAANKKIREIKDSGNYGKAVEIYKDGGVFKHRISTKERAAVEHKGGHADAPIILYGELPEETPEKYLNVSGLDDYKLNTSDTDSLGAFYSIRRRNLAINTPCETILASFVAKPPRHTEFHDRCEMILEAFAAECLMESADTTFEDHLERKGKAYKWLAPALTYSKSKDGRNNNSKLQKKFGLYPTAGNNNHRFQYFVDWCHEKHTIGVMEDGTEITKYGVEHIDDIDLLEEIVNWQFGKNCDRIVAFSHALIWARELDINDVRPKSQKTNRGILLRDQRAREEENAGQPKRKKPTANDPYGRRGTSPYSTKR